MEKRLEYIDALRGLAMFMVVFVHIEGFCFFNFSHISFLGSMLSLVHLPLFFFISGLLALKLTIPTKKQILNKVHTLLIPMCLLGLIYSYLFLKRDVNFFLFDTAKAGYWFTLVLFQMYFIVYVVQYFAYRYFPSSGNKWITFLLILAIIMYFGKYPMRKIDVLNEFGNVSSLHYTMNYFQFFVLGIFTALYKKKLNMLFLSLKKMYFVSAVLGCVFFVSAYYKYYMLDKCSIYVEGLDKIISMLIGTFCGYCGVIGLYILLKKRETFFGGNSICGRILTLIGRRTLDIYLLHYFFLNIISLGEYSSYLTYIFLEILLVGSISFLIIGLSLMLSFVIRKNALLSSLLLGVKTK